MDNDKCVWLYTEGDDDYWNTECGESFSFFAGTPEENGFTYCPYCGKPLEMK